MWRSIALFLLLASVAVSAQTKAFTKTPGKIPQPETTASDSSVRELLSNSQIRVVRVDLEPGKSTRIARHEYDFVVVALTESNFKFDGPSNSIKMAMQPNEIQVMKGHWPHQVVNSGVRPIHLIEVEVKHGIAPEQALCGLNASTCTESKFAYEKSGGYVSGTLFETPSIKLSRVEIDPNAAFPEHGHKGGHVMIALTDQQLTNAIVGGDVTEIAGHPGDPTWLGGGIVHKLQNHGAQKTQFLVIECK